MSSISDRPEAFKTVEHCIRKLGITVPFDESVKLKDIGIFPGGKMCLAMELRRERLNVDDFGEWKTISDILDTVTDKEPSGG